MEQTGIISISAYLRKMAIDGYVIKLELPELKEMISLLRRSSNNLNQIAKRVNSTDRIYAEDMEEILRWQENSGTFTFTGTASNPGFDVSSSIYCDLTNNSRIPKSAIVDSITTTGSMSQSVGGVTTYLNPGGQGWLESRTSGSRGSFDLGLEYGVSARQRWEFKYKQTAFASTKMSSVKMTIYWYADINENNYERWPVGPTI